MRYNPVLQVTDECAAVGLVAGAVVLRGLTVGDSTDALRGAIGAAASRVRQRFESLAALRETPEIQAFRAVYRAVGANPNRHVPACQRLLELAWTRRDLPRVNSLVDLYNLVSVDNLLSVGAHDLGRVRLPIRLAITPQDETFTPLGSTAVSRAKQGEFVYLDATGRVICRLDHVQAEFSKITTETISAVVILQGTRAHDPARVAEASRALIDLARQHCGAMVDGA